MTGNIHTYVWYMYLHMYSAYIADITLPKCHNHLVSFIKVEGLSVPYIVDIFGFLARESWVSVPYSCHTMPLENYYYYVPSYIYLHTYIYMDEWRYYPYMIIFILSIIMWHYFYLLFTLYLCYLITNNHHKILKEVHI